MRKTILFLALAALVSTGAGATLRQTTSQYLVDENPLQNPGFENGRQKWTASTPAHFTLDTSTPYAGTTSAVWNSTAASDTFSGNPITITEGMQDEGGCLIAMHYKWDGAAGNLEWKVKEASNTLVVKDLEPSSIWREDFMAFPCGDAGNTVTWQLEATADAEAISIDRTWLGHHNKMFEFSQSTVHGTSVWAASASCNWSSTSSTWAAFAVDSNCDFGEYTTTGKLVAPSTKIPAAKTDVTPGKYLVTIQGEFYSDTASCGFRISDGTSTSGFILSSDQGTSARGSGLVGYFEYAAPQADVVYQVQVQRQAGAGTCQIKNEKTTNDFDSLQFNVLRFPTSA